MNEEQKPIIYVISMNADTSLTFCIFSMVKAKEFNLDTDGATALNPYSKQKYVPEDGDIIIEIVDQRNPEWKTALINPAHKEDAEAIYKYLTSIFKYISFYKIKIENPHEFNPFDWEYNSSIIFEKH